MLVVIRVEVLHRGPQAASTIRSPSRARRASSRRSSCRASSARPSSGRTRAAATWSPRPSTASMRTRTTPSCARSASPSRARAFPGRCVDRDGDVRLLAARSAHRGDEPAPDPADLGPLPLRLSRRARPVRRRVRRALRRLLPRGRRIRGAARARAALLHADQRDHLLCLLGGEWGWVAPFGKTGRQAPRAAPRPVPGRHRRREGDPRGRSARRAWSTSTR